MPSPTRSLAPDLARGIMLLLIASAYAMVYVGAGFGTPVSGLGVADQVVAVASALLLDNRAFPLFAILFGAGLAWSVRRKLASGAAPRRVRRDVRRRGLFLLLFGAVHAFLVFPGEILRSYGLAALLTGWLLFRSDLTQTRAIVVLSLLYLVTVPLAAIGGAMAGTADSFAVPGYTMPADWIARAINVPILPVYLAFSYPLLVLVVIGFRIGRAGLLDRPDEHRGTLRAWAFAGIAVSVVGAIPAALIMLGWWQLGTWLAGLAHAVQILTGVCGGLGYAALFTLAGRRSERSGPGPVARALAAVGRRSLTFYLLNSVVVAVVLHPDLIGLGSHVGPAGGLAVAVGSWLVSLACATALERSSRPGPADALMRRLVAGRRKPRGVPTPP